MTWPNRRNRKCKLNIPFLIICNHTDKCKRKRQQMWTNSTTLLHTQAAPAGTLKWISWSSKNMTWRIWNYSYYRISDLHCAFLQWLHAKKKQVLTMTINEDRVKHWAAEKQTLDSFKKCTKSNTLTLHCFLPVCSVHVQAQSGSSL